jgi:tripartite-type tricarboxylate transporter receptor subunit TctC
MKLPHRRRFLHLAAGATALPVMSRIASAQAYPTRPVRIIVAFPPGVAPDINARRIAHWLSERTGQSFFVENRPGASGNLGTEAAVRATPDGYTLLYVGANNFVSAALFDNLKFDFARDIAPVASFSQQSNVMVVPLSSPTNSVPEFIALAKASPGKLNMASAGVGTSPHLSGELFQILTGIKLQHVPYRGLSMGGYADLMAGNVQVAFDNLMGAIELVRAGKLKILAVTTKARAPALPDVPSISEFVAGYEASAISGIGAPRGTSTEIINKLNHEINAALADPVMRQQIAESGGTALSGSPENFGRIIVGEIEKWGKVIRTANIKPE